MDIRSSRAHSGRCGRASLDGGHTVLRSPDAVAHAERIPLESDRAQLGNHLVGAQDMRTAGADYSHRLGCEGATYHSERADR